MYADGKLAIVSTSNAGTLLTTDATPLLTVDVGTRVCIDALPHARPNYLEHFWALVNWGICCENSPHSLSTQKVRLLRFREGIEYRRPISEERKSVQSGR